MASQASQPLLYGWSVGHKHKTLSIISYYRVDRIKPALNSRIFLGLRNVRMTTRNTKKQEQNMDKFYTRFLLSLFDFQEGEKLRGVFFSIMTLQELLAEFSYAKPDDSLTIDQQLLAQEGIGQYSLKRDELHNLLNSYFAGDHVDLLFGKDSPSLQTKKLCGYSFKSTDLIYRCMDCGGKGQLFYI
jgi:hypothetical protein